MNMHDLRQSEQQLTQALEAYQQKDTDRALSLLDAALKIQPQRADAWTLRGMVLRQQGALDEARQSHLHAIALQPGYAHAYNNLGNLEREAQRPDHAVELYEKATALQPDDASLWGNLGSALALIGAHARAEQALRKAVALNPKQADAHWDLALALLNQGQFAEAFKFFEWRFERGQPARPAYRQPVWDGQSLSGTLLLYSEQGYGDCIQYLRFLPYILDRVSAITLFVHPPVAPLVQALHLKGVTLVTALPEHAEFDAHASLLSLPALIEKSDTLLGQTGFYIAIEHDKKRQWRAKLQALPGLKIGLVWAGNPNVKNDRIRSPRLSPLRPLLDQPGIQWMCLQKGDGLRDLEGVALPPQFHILDNSLHDFLDTACAMLAMDLVITSDTSVAHLAGALGVRTWVLNPAIPDWRWVGELRDTSHWYLNTRVYRAHSTQQWNAVVAMMQADLNALLAARNGDDRNVNAALDLFRAGQHAEAWERVQRALDADPDRTDVWNLAAVIAKNRGAVRWAEMAYRRALHLNDAFPDARRNLAHLLKAQQRHTEALPHYQTVCDRGPDVPGHWTDLSDCLRLCGELKAARKAAGRALALSLDNAEAWNVLGAACTELGEPDQAQHCFKVALTLDERYVEAQYNLGVSLHKQGDPKGALACFERALQLKPDHCSAQYNLGSCQQELGLTDAAEHSFRAALQRKPDHFPSLFSLAAMCHFSGKFSEAYALETQCLQRNPDMLAMQVDRHYLALKIGHWGDIPALPELMRKLFAQETLDEPPPPFSLMVLPTPMQEGDQLKIARAWAHVKTRHVKPMPARKPDPAAGKTRRYRIGYASSDFHNHATMHLMRGLFPAHDRSRFEIFAYSWGPDDNSPYRQGAKQDIEHFRELRGMTSREMAHAMADDQLDLLIDLKGHTRDSRIEVFHYRPAPVQAQYLGYPGSLGTACMDFIITDRVVTPPAQQAFYTERFAYLPHCYQVNDAEQPIDTAVPCRSDAGLPEKAFVFACFCSHYKIDPFVFGVWMNVLKAVPDSVLWLLEGPDSVMQNFRHHAEQAGLEANRIVFGKLLAKPRHLARLGLADLFLDTRWYNAHTTASDALWAGVPVLTCPGQTFAQRVGASLVSAIEMPELIAKDWKHYEKLAIDIARNRTRAAQLKMKLAGKRHSAPLFRTEQFARDLEALFVEMVKGPR